MPLAVVGLTTAGLFVGRGMEAIASPDLDQSNAVSIEPIRNTRTVAADSEISDYLSYREVINQTRNMVSDTNATELAEVLGLNILDVTWEDTGRYYNSAVGPNISDMTIQVQQQDPRTGQYELSLMPVIRHPNFIDESADIPLEQFFLQVGNEREQALQRVSLKDFLGDLRRYLSQPGSWKGRDKSLLADRDTHVLVSAQACFLPISPGGIAEFNPVLFNYQSYPGDPAVLTILATREGTSVTVIDNQRDAFDAGQTWGQRLFFNQNGQRASLTGRRMSDFVATAGGQSSSGESNGADAVESAGLNMVLLIQVPLKQKQPMRVASSLDVTADVSQNLAMPAAASLQQSDVEAAVIGHGEVEGPFTEIDDLEIERDPDFPIRVTVQFYKGTSNGVVSEQDMQEIHQQIARVYEDADYVGSLVVAGETDRPTEYDGPKQEPKDWWEQFWQRYTNQPGQSRQSALEIWRQLREERQ
ncbi:MAG: hypothetical protein F6K19_46230 [Cyanothece sp. SIO1E1]|nr:hypothetical protein [Cyanothece sp. SIO1E1]